VSAGAPVPEFESGEGRMRVIVVAAPEAARRLRGDGSLEVVRASNVFEAIGEVGLPLGEPAPGGAMIVGRDEARRAGSGLREGVRSLDPAMRLLAIDTDAPEFDGVAPSDLTPEGLRAALAGLTREPSAADPGEPAPPEPSAGPEDVEPPTEPVDVAAAPAAAEAASDSIHVLSESPVEALLRGHDPLAPALATIRERTGARDAVFVRDALTTQERRRGLSEAPVERRGRRFGYLRSGRVDASGLVSAAEELGAWLALAEQHRQLRDAAFVDPLTGAWNRRYLDLFLGRSIDRARTDRRYITLLLFDIDDFKRYNDRFGHAAGDEILIETVRLLRSVIRPTDRVCRLGGDEFVVVFDEPEGPRTPGSRHPESIRDLAERFQRQIREHRFPKLGEEAPATLTISGGMATFPWDGTDPGSLVEQADRLALQSKRQGKNVVTFGPDVAPEVCSSDRPDASERGG